ncbi:hypothetical protein BD626DRAFT_514440 [Schizophyllum amplum]|uniref:Mediator of RNA polymerase II transcription subunit 16 n=1 Tax=Schizophyllum amplum TaxID=97359 RepID=A0A550BYH7_9AGAR|nr:hypothetical protein BD626DRAFT_514440 [Auriculariopsis ampla]
MFTAARNKDKQETEWEADWWQFQPLLDHTPSRPVEWSTCSLIFTAHHTSPILTARHFSSSKQFELPSPHGSNLQHFMTAFRPPSLISAAPTGDWLFAYYPGNDAESRCCLWQRGHALDSWNVKDFWHEPSDVVAAEWIGVPREWTVDEERHATRLPPRGPATPVLQPALVIITRSNNMKLVYYRHYQPNMKMIPVTLGHQMTNTQEDNSKELEHAEVPGSVRLIGKAAISLNYNDSSLLIATRVHRVPAREANDSVPYSFEDDLQNTDWEQWGEQPTIELAECLLGFDGKDISIQVRIIPSILSRATPVGAMAFVSRLPAPSGGQQSLTGPGHRYLVVSHLDFGDYTSPPSSELVSYSLAAKAEGQHRHWEIREEAARNFDPDVVASLVPCKVPTCGIFATVVHRSGKIPKGRDKACIGKICALDLPNLSDIPDWPSTVIMAPARHVSRDPPLYAAISPNGILLCTVSNSLVATRASIYTLPRPAEDTISPFDDEPVPYLARLLGAAVLGHKSTNDVTHLLALPTTPLIEARDTLVRALLILELNMRRVNIEVRHLGLGLAVEVYRSRALRAKDMDKADLDRRWRAGRDMCSLFTCTSAFEECNEDGGFDLDALWQLVGLSSWIVSYVERLMKEAVQFANRTIPAPSDDDDLFGSLPASPSSPSAGIAAAVDNAPSPVLLPLAHNIAMTSIDYALQLVDKLCTQVGTVKGSDERSLLAKNVLGDLVNCAGISMKEIRTSAILEDITIEMESMDGEQQRFSLMACRPTKELRGRVHAASRRLALSPALDKMRLFVRPAELIDGLGRMSLTDFDMAPATIADDAASPPDSGMGSSAGVRKDRDRDIVTKAPLTQQSGGLVCVRCGGRSDLLVELADTGIPCRSWRIWEGKYEKECICGGAWMTAANS